MRITSTSTKKNIGSILRERRINKRISQREMAVKSGVTQTFLSLIEHGKRIPYYGVLFRIAEVLGEDATFLESEARNADLDSVSELNILLKRLFGSGNKKKLNKLLEFIQTLG